MDEAIVASFQENQRESCHIPCFMDVLCIGAAHIDRIFRTRARVQPETSNPAEQKVSFGGVARNVAETLARLGRNVGLVAALGDDGDGASIRAGAVAIGIDVTHVRMLAGRVTGTYAAILDPSGDLVVGACDPGPIDAIDASTIDALAPLLETASWVFADANLAAPALGSLLSRRAEGAPFRLALDGVSVAKVQRLPRDLAQVDLFFLNAHQAAQLPSLPNARAVVTTRGSAGAELIVDGRTHAIPAVAVEAVDVTGAGDALAAATIHYLLEGATHEAALRDAMHVAAAKVTAPWPVQ